MESNNDMDLMDNVLQGDEFDMDMELFEMRKQYNEMKRERLDKQKNYSIMENKIKLLESEEQNVKKTLNRQIMNKTTMVKKMAELGSAKEELIKSKMDQQKELKERSEKMQQMKEDIKSTLKTYRDSVREKNLKEAQKQKEIKNEILELKKEQQNEILNKNKLTKKIVRDQIKGFSEKKKQDEVKRKLQLKEELAKKMKEEPKVKEELEDKLNKCEIKESNLIEKISQTKQGLNSTKTKFT
jgi:chromosome segregation ATPase